MNQQCRTVYTVMKHLPWFWNNMLLETYILTNLNMSWEICLTNYKCVVIKLWNSTVTLSIHLMVHTANS